MKNLSALAFYLLFVNLALAGETYEKAMTTAIGKLFQAQTTASNQDAANQFERIATIEKADWLPLYYASYAYIQMTFQEQDAVKKDAYLDQAQKLLDAAMKLAPEESELYMLQGFLYPARINIDPMARGAQYFGEMNRALDKSLELNPDNPRVYFLRAMMTLNMPEAFGGGAAKALPIFNVAQEKFEIFQPKTALSPNWGKEANEFQLKKLQESGIQ